MRIKVVCLDFDGVINNYPGWQDEGFAVIHGEPVEGAKEATKTLRDAGWLVLVHSTRCGYSGGTAAIVEYLNQYNIRVDGVCTNKPPADIYVDDRGIQFKGDWAELLSSIQAFQQWQHIDQNK